MKRQRQITLAFPAEVLQLLSFGSILVTPHMQDLNI